MWPRRIILCKQLRGKNHGPAQGWLNNSTFLSISQYRKQGSSSTIFLTFVKINISTYGLSHIFYCYLGHTLLMCGFHFCLDPRFKYTYIHTWRAISTLQLWWNYKSIMGYVLHHSWSAEFAQPNCKCFHWLKHYNINTLKLIWKLILEINYSYKNHI